MCQVVSGAAVFLHGKLRLRVVQFSRSHLQSTADHRGEHSGRKRNAMMCIRQFAPHISCKILYHDLMTTLQSMVEHAWARKVFSTRHVRIYHGLLVSHDAPVMKKAVHGPLNSTELHHHLFRLKVDMPPLGTPACTVCLKKTIECIHYCAIPVRYCLSCTG